MKLNINEFCVSLLLAVCLFTACDDWTETENLTIHSPSLKEQNPELYARYVQSLNDYESTKHQVVIVSVDNASSLPSLRNQHLTNLPDSIDYICLNNIMEVNTVHITEMETVREWGTKMLGLVDFDAIISQWNKLLEEENAGLPQETVNGRADELANGKNNVSTRFVEYCHSETMRRIQACNALGVDGIVVKFTGFDLHSLVEEEEISTEMIRQAAFFDIITDWKIENADKILIFSGSPQNLVNKGILSDCKYIIVYAHSVRNQYEMSYVVLMALAEEIPSDRYVIGVSTPYLTNSGSYNGEFSDGSSAVIGAAQWAIMSNPDYIKAGISIDSAERDYFNANKIYLNIREAINILNPTVK